MSSIAVYDELIRFASIKTDDPAIRAKQLRAVRVVLENFPEVVEESLDKERQKGIDEGRLDEAREVLRSVLQRRGLVLSSEDQARIDACTVLVTLRRWYGQAVDAQSAEEALGPSKGFDCREWFARLGWEGPR